MIVVIGKKGYKMSQKQYRDFLNKVAKTAVPFGIYAVEKDGQAHMLLEHCTSTTQLKKKTAEYRQNGYKVYSNRGAS